MKHCFNFFYCVSPLLSFPYDFLSPFFAHPISILLNEDSARYKHSFVVANDPLQTFFLFFVLHFYHISFFGRSNSDFCNKPRSQTIKVRWNALFPPSPYIHFQSYTFHLFPLSLSLFSSLLFFCSFLFYLSISQLVHVCYVCFIVCLFDVILRIIFITLLRSVQ